MKILIYEDSDYKNLYPLNLLRASYDLRCGANTILERVESIIGSKFEITLHCRNNLALYLKEDHKNKINSISKDDYLILNGRAIFTEDSIKYLLSKKEKNSLYTFKGDNVAAYITKDKIKTLKDKVESEDNVFDEELFRILNLKCISLNENYDIKMIKYAWDFIEYILQGGMEADLNYFLNFKQNKKFQRVKSADGFIEHKKILVKNEVNIYPEAVLDAFAGKILIDERTTVEPFTYIKGPVYIGKNCLIKSGSKIYGPCVIGESSKVAGEIAESIFHSYVNKQHDGFIGHSYVCPFVNLGADTVTSDLKNNYSTITMKLGGNEVDTGMQFLGSIIGDHSKTSINTMLNTGSIIGIFTNIFGGGFPPKEIKSFTWNESGKDSNKYDIDKAIETAKIVMGRRGIKMSHAYEKVLRDYSNNL